MMNDRNSNKLHRVIVLESFLKAVEEGDADAQCELGRMYATGLGIPQDFQKAFHWWMTSAGQGNVHAQYHLGIMYRNGYGVPQDYAKASEWALKAAEQGLPEAKQLLQHLMEQK